MTGSGTALGRAALVVALLAGLVVGAGQVTQPLTSPGELLGTGSVPGGGGIGRAADAATSAPVSAAALVCAGPEQQGLTDRSVAEPDQVVWVGALTAPEVVLPEEARTPAPGRLVLQPTGVSAEEAVDSRGQDAALRLTGAEAVLVMAEGGLAAGLAAAQAQLSLQAPGRGLGVTPCTRPQEDSWLVAGGAQPGRTEHLVLVNPGADPVTATVRVLGGGRPDQADAEGVVVPAGGRVVSLLDALAPGVGSPVVQVSSAGGPVAAFLGDRWAEGTVDRGLELTAPVGAPARTVVIPGVARRPGQGAVTAVRVGVPGDEQAVVQVRALTGDGPVRVRQDVTLVPGGQTQDILLTDLPAGEYAVEVTGDVPVVAAAWAGSAPAAVRDAATRLPEGSGTELPPGGTGDLAWAGSTAPLSGLAGLPMPDLAGPPVTATLHLAARQAGQVEVTVVAGDGTLERRQVQVPAGSTARVGLAGAASVWVHPRAAEVHAAVTMAGAGSAGGLLSTVPLHGLPLTRSLTSVAPVLP